MASFLMGDAHPTDLPRYTAPRCNVFPALRARFNGRSISRAVLSCFLRIGGNHICDCHQSSATVIYPQLHCVGWALPNTKQAFQDMVWYYFEGQCPSYPFVEPDYRAGGNPGNVSLAVRLAGILDTDRVQAAPTIILTTVSRFLSPVFCGLMVITFRLARISHKDRCERPESAMNTGLQRQKAHRHIEIFRGRFLVLYPRRHGAFRPCSRSLVRNAG